MLDKAKKIATTTPTKLFAGRKGKDLTADEVQIARDYIATYWTKLERYHPKDEGSLIGVPKPYLVPSYAEGHEFALLDGFSLL